MLTYYSPWVCRTNLPLHQLQETMSTDSRSVWRRHVSQQTGKPYWYNSETKDSTYSDPFTRPNSSREIAEVHLPSPPASGSRTAAAIAAAAIDGTATQAWFDAVEAAAFDAAMEGGGEESDGECKYFSNLFFSFLFSFLFLFSLSFANESGFVSNVYYNLL